jgi:hypothetical protein
MLYKGLLYFFPFFPLPVPEPLVSVWSLRDQLRVAQFVAPLSHNLLGIMGISSVSFRWSRKEGMKHNFRSPKSMIIRFLAKNVLPYVLERVLYIVLFCWVPVCFIVLWLFKKAVDADWTAEPSFFSFRLCLFFASGWGRNIFYQERGNLMCGGHSLLERYSKEACVFGM